ncbi:rhodanese-like domain-containing protein [Achromobacter xylosoxidans]|nr:rhodanese-like domain-containing protein [Achromobacter xylosoxidans]PJM86763.1 rhodanese [Achromobacter ruhlandii]
MLAIPALRKGRTGSAVSTTEAIQMVNQRQAVWVDVRPAEQFQAGHIAQARSVPAADLEQKAASLPKNKPLVVVCDNGRDSARAAAKLRAQGFADVVPLEGGMRAWLAASLPVTQKG